MQNEERGCTSLLLPTHDPRRSGDSAERRTTIGAGVWRRSTETPLRFKGTRRGSRAVESLPIASQRGEGEIFVGRLPRVARASQPWADFCSAFSAFEFAAIRDHDSRQRT
jgi:hypothetical protein